MTAKIKRHDYEVRIEYTPAPGPKVQRIGMCNCADGREASDAAVKGFLRDNPGAVVLGVETRRR